MLTGSSEPQDLLQDLTTQLMIHANVPGPQHVRRLAHKFVSVYTFAIYVYVYFPHSLPQTGLSSVDAATGRAYLRSPLWTTLALVIPLVANLRRLTPYRFNSGCYAAPHEARAQDSAVRSSASTHPTCAMHEGRLGTEPPSAT